MAKKNSDLFERLRKAGLRKQAAKALSQTTDTASKKAQRTARAAAKELRAIADEIERRLPPAKEEPAASGAKATATPRSRSAASRSSRPSGARGSRTSAAAPRAGASAKPRTRRAPAPKAEPTAPVQPPADASASDGDAPSV